MANLVYMEDDRVDGETERIDPVRNAMWSILVMDDASVVSTSPEVLAKMMVVIVTLCKAAGLTMSDKKTENIMLWTQHEKSKRGPLSDKAANQAYE